MLVNSTADAMRSKVPWELETLQLSFRNLPVDARDPCAKSTKDIFTFYNNFESLTDGKRFKMPMISCDEGPLPPVPPPCNNDISLREKNGGEKWHYDDIMCPSIVLEVGLSYRCARWKLTKINIFPNLFIFSPPFSFVIPTSPTIAID